MGRGKKRAATKPSITESSTGPKGSDLIDDGKPADDKQSKQEKALPNGYDLSTGELLYNLKESDPGLNNVVVVTTIPKSIQVPHGETQSVWIVRPSTKSKVLNASGYPARLPKFREDLYEIKSTPDMGKGLFAKRDICRGEIIFAERPLLVLPELLEIPSESLRGSPSLELEALKQAFQSTEGLLEAAIAHLPPEREADFRALSNHYKPDQCGQLLGIMTANNFALRNLFDGSDPSANYKVVTKIAARLNHSCVSNVKHYFKVNSFSIQFFALRDIKAGDQLFYPYCLTDRTHAQRQADLMPYDFECKCPGCLNATPETDKFRIAFKRRIAFFREALMSRPKLDEIMLETALRFEKEVLKEGLDADDEYLSLLMAISAGYSKLGKGEESRKYSALAEKFTKFIRDEWKGLPVPQS